MKNETITFSYREVHDMMEKFRRMLHFHHKFIFVVSQMSPANPAIHVHYFFAFAGAITSFRNTRQERQVEGGATHEARLSIFLPYDDVCI